MRTPDSDISRMDEKNAFMQAVENFEDTKGPLPDVLERFIAHIAQTGEILSPWEKVQKVFTCKLLLVLDEFYESNPYKFGKVNANTVNDDFEEMKKRLLQLTEEFDSPPFTIQRLCELLSEPKKNYTKCDKFMRGVEKNLMVVSSWHNAPRRPSDVNDRVNGIASASNGFFSTTDMHKSHWANLPPSPAAMTPPKIEGAPDFTTPDVSQETKQESEEETSPMQTNETNQENETSEVKDQISSESEFMKPDEETNREEDIAVDKTEDAASAVVPANKRKLEEEDETPPSKEDNSLQEVGEEDEEESPTKRAKQDEEHLEEVASHDTDQESDKTSQMTEETNRVQDDSVKSSEGTSVDLEKTDDEAASVDVQN